MPQQIINVDLGDTLFQGTAQDVMATPDVYGSVNTQVINTTVGKKSFFDNSLLSGLKSGIGSSSLFGGLDVNANSVSQMTSPDALMNRVSASLGSTPAQFGTSFKSSLLQAAGNTQLGLGGYTVQVGSSIQRISTLVDAGALKGSLMVLNQATNNSQFTSFIDEEAQSLGLSSAASNLIKAGLRQATLQALMSASTPAVQKQSIQTVLPQAVGAGDLDTVALAISKMGANGVLAALPTAIDDLLQSYKMPANTTAAGYPAEAAKLTGILSQLDPHWDTVVRGSETLPSLKHFGRLSADAVKVLSTNPTYAALAAMGPSFQPQNPVDGLKKDFPNMLLVS